MLTYLHYTDTKVMTAHTALRLALMIVVTRCQILRLKCSKFDFVWGSAADLAGFKGFTFKGRQEKG